MHLHRNLYPMLRGKRRVFYPIRCDHFVPLPFQNVAVVGRPGTSDRVRRSGLKGISGATGKIHHNRPTEFFSQQNRLAAYLASLPRPICVRMQRIAVTTESANARTMVSQFALELSECGAALKH